MNDFLSQIRQLQKMGGLGGIMSMLPGIGKMQKQIAAAGVDDNMIKRQEAIILSMTKKERISVGLLNASRRKRIASGSGTSVQDVNRLVKQYQDMARMMKKLGGKGGASAMKALLGGGGPFGGGGMGGAMGGGNMPDLGALAKGLGGKMPGGLSGGLPGGLPGLGRKPPEDKK
jgi:signal recognition particle subunit SRP54